MVFIFARCLPAQAQTINVFHNVLAAHISQYGNSNNTRPHPQDLRSLTQLKFTSHSLCISDSSQQAGCTGHSHRGADPRDWVPSWCALPRSLRQGKEKQDITNRLLKLCLEVTPITSAPFRQPKWHTAKPTSGTVGLYIYCVPTWKDERWDIWKQPLTVPQLRYSLPRTVIY